MLVQYSVENFKSIKDEIVINFSAEEDAKDKEWITSIEEKNCFLYKAIGLIGPNASGKSNIIDSFYFAIRFINNTIRRKENSKINVEPFMLNEKNKKDATKFEFIFYSEGVKYVYGFSINSEKVIEEYLMAYFTAKPKTIFERNNCSEYDFKGNDTKTQKEISDKTNDNRLYLPVAAEWGYEKVSKVYKWFINTLKQYGEMNVSEVIEKVISKKERKEMLIEALQKADFNISDIYVKNRKIEKEQIDLVKQLFSQFAKNMDEINVPESRPIIYITHKNSKENEFSIPLDEDSAGTEKIIDDLAELLYISESGGIFLADELGKVYHTKLTQHFLSMFKSKTVNLASAQLLFSSHDTKILNFLNPDQIYLVDKDDEGATYVKLLSDYVIRDKDNIELGYLKGRYGAIPYFKE